MFNPTPEESIMTTAAKTFTTLTYEASSAPALGTEEYIVTTQAGDVIIDTAWYSKVPVNNSGQECAEGLLGSWTEGATTKCRYSHGPLKILALDPIYEWGYDSGELKGPLVGYEITWG
jgi:hypothetical protein